MILLLACASIDGFEVEADPDIATVVHVRFTTSAAVAAHVEYGDAQSTPEGPVGTEHAFTVLGLAAGKTYDFTPVAGDLLGNAVSFAVGTPPGDVARFEVLTEGPGPNFTLTSHITGDEGSSSVLILDQLGRTTWYVRPDWGHTPVARFGHDGTTVIYLVTSKEHVENAVVRRQALAGGAYEEVATPYAHHDVVEVPGIDFAYIAAEGREVDGESVVGDKIVERLADGSEREVWNAFDWFEVVENEGWNAGYYPFGVDWTHANGLFYDEASDSYLISLYYIDTVVSVDRATGTINWQLGGDDTDFVLPEGFVFRHQHAPSVAPGGEVCVYDNAGGSDGSRGLCFTLGNGEATLAWSFDPPDDRRSILLGDVDRFDDGSSLVAFGEHGEVTQVSPGGTVEWEIDAADIGVVGKVEARNSLYAE